MQLLIDIHNACQDFVSYIETYFANKLKVEVSRLAYETAGNVSDGAK